MKTMAPADSETDEVIDGIHLTQLVAGEQTSAQHSHIEPGARVSEHSHEQRAMWPEAR
jgi:quercetin dioxygenase-like cupin family protein